jgi:mono/diheme cytochrome c family protein
MKKTHFILVAVFVLSVVTILAFNPSKAVSQKKTAQSVNSIPDNVMAVFNNSCVSCHGEGGNGMAMSMVNFSAWDTYSATKQAKKATAICNAITNGSMPPSSVRSATPGRIPTTAQTEIVCKWANSLNAK